MLLDRRRVFSYNATVYTGEGRKTKDGSALRAGSSLFVLHLLMNQLAYLPYGLPLHKEAP